jgi:multisubunit Na+/H+ antiporter MnhC subunit
VLQTRLTRREISKGINIEQDKMMMMIITIMIIDNAVECEILMVGPVGGREVKKGY